MCTEMEAEISFVLLQVVYRLALEIHQLWVAKPLDHGKTQLQVSFGVCTSCGIN